MSSKSSRKQILLIELLIAFWAKRYYKKMYFNCHVFNRNALSIYTAMPAGI